MENCRNCLLISYILMPVLHSAPDCLGDFFVCGKGKNVGGWGVVEVVLCVVDHN